MTISRVQGNQVNSGSSVTSQAVTLGSGVTAGNLLVAAVTVGSNSTSITGPTGWTQAVINNPAGGSALVDASIWWAIVGVGGVSAGGTSWTWTFGASHTVYMCIEEWNSTTGWMASPVDQTAQGDTAGTPVTATTIVSGTTSTTLEASELWIASLAYKGSAQTESSITAGWTKDLESTIASNTTMTMLYQIASSTGAAACQYTISSAQFWAGAVATFKPTISRIIPATAALQSLSNGRTIPATAALQSTNSRTIPATAALTVTSSRTIPASASLINTISRTVPATAALQGTFSRTISSVTAALTVTSSRTIPASASLAQSAVFYASNVAQTAGGITQSDQMSMVSGGTETSVSITMPSSGTNSYVELLAQGGTASGTSALPAPTGKGWSISLAGNTILAGNWYSAFTLAKSGTTKTGASLIVRWYRRTMDGTYYPIGVSTLSSQTYSTTKTVYTTPSVNANWQWQFISGDTLYMDAFVFNAGTAWASDVFTVYVSNSASLGVFNDGIIVSPQLITTPAELNCLIGAPSFQTANSGLPVRDQSFTLADALDQRSILTLTGEDVNGTLSYQRGQPVMFSDHDLGLLYTGYVNSDKVSKPAAGGAAQLEHMLTMMDHHYDADKRANVANYLNWTAGDMVCDFIQSTLSQEGITGAFALESDYTPTAFSQGTLSGTVATTTTSPFTYAPNTASPPVTSNTGDLELTRAGTQFTLTESVTSDFSSGTLTNMTAASNSLTPSTQNALKIQAQLPAASGGNMVASKSGASPIVPESVPNTAYAKIWSGSMTVGTNDTLNYDIWIASTSPAFLAGVDILFSDGSLLSSNAGTVDTNLSPGLFDTNNLSVDIITDLSNYAKDTWYTRNITLTGLNGKTINAVSVYISGASAGTVTVYIKNCYLGSQSGSPFFGTGATAPQVNPPTVTTTGGYLSSLVRSSVVAVWNPVNTYRISPAHSISAVQLVQNSTISWTASTPTFGSSVTSGSPGAATTATAMLIFVSYDGNAWLPCTNAAALPGLPAGANVNGLSLYLREQFSCGQDPSALPSLLQVTITINSAASASTTDVTASYGTATQWNTGTESGIAPNAGGQLALLGAAFIRDWNDTLITNQTFYPNFGGITQSASTGKYAISCPSTGGFASSRFDFAGVATDFTIECDLVVGSSSGSGNFAWVGPCYRQTGWSTADDNFAYYIAIGAGTGLGGVNNLQLGYGSNSNSSTAGTFTVIAATTLTINAGTSYHLKIVVTGPRHTIYFNNSGTAAIDILDSTYLSAGNVGLRTLQTSTSTVTSSIDNFSLTPSPVGVWTSPSISLSALGTCGNTQISWSELNTIGDAQSTAVVSASLDGGSTWKLCTNGATTPTAIIPGLPVGTNVTGKSLLIQVVLSAQSRLVSPVIWGLSVRVCGSYGTVTGTRISPALSLSPVGYVASSNCMWNANIPTNTTLTVATSQDASTWTNVGNNGAGASLGYWTNQPAATQDLFNTNTSGNYTNTSKSGGSAAVAVYDLSNSRITLSGGSSGLYLNTSAGAMTDMDMLCDMDESDAGGLVWREVDTSDYYELGVYDASSSGGFTNQLRLYKVSSGTRSLLGSASSIVFTRGTFHRIRVTMQSGLINVYWDGTCVQSYLDTSPLGSGLCGLRNDGGTSRYYQLWVQPLGTNLTGQVLYTKVTMTTTDPSVMPQLFTLVACVRGPSIATGATISQLHPVTTPFASYYSNEMDALVQSSGDYYWYIDRWRQLHFGPRLARPGAFPVQSIALDAPNNYSGYLLYQPQVTVLSSADLFRSQQIVTNVTGLVTPPPEVKVADGSTTSWTLGYPVYSAPTILVNGQPTTVGVQGIDNNRQFYWQPGSASISYDSSLPKLPAGAILNITYVGESTVNVTLNNGTTQAAQAASELNSGIVAEIESAMRTGTNGMTTSQATTFGNGLLARYGNNGTIEMIGVTQYQGLAPGTVIPIFLPEMMNTWNSQLPLVKVTTTAYQGINGLIWLSTIDATSGPNLSNWARAWGLGGTL